MVWMILFDGLQPHWYCSWDIGNVVFDASDNKVLQDEKNVRFNYLFDESHSKWIVSTDYLWSY